MGNDVPEPIIKSSEGSPLVLDVVPIGAENISPSPSPSAPPPESPEPTQSALPAEQNAK